MLNYFRQKRRKIINNFFNELGINTLTNEEWLNILKEFKYKCAYCGIEFDENILPEKDHIIPRSKGGYNIKENIIPSCRYCNSKKHNKILDSNNLPIPLFRNWFFN
jgi:5-methylcytosine-specific restriction endonuclease McrA